MGVGETRQSTTRVEKQGSSVSKKQNQKTCGSRREWERGKRLSTTSVWKQGGSQKNQHNQKRGPAGAEGRVRGRKIVHYKATETGKFCEEAESEDRASGSRRERPGEKRQSTISVGKRGRHVKKKQNQTRRGTRKEGKPRADQRKHTRREDVHDRYRNAGKSCE